MSIIRVEHNRNYTCIRNEALRDNRLSFKARGIHHLLLSYPDNWSVTIEHIVKQSDKDGRAAIMTAITELQECGYVTMKRVRDETTGKFIGWEKVVRETPIPELETITTEVRKSDVGTEVRKTVIRKNRNTEKPHDGKSDYIINTDSNQYPVEEVSTLPPTPPSELKTEREERTEKNLRTYAIPHPLASSAKQSELIGKEPTSSQSDKCSAPAARHLCKPERGTPSSKTFVYRKRTVKRFNRTAVKQDWEIQPGVPYPAFVKWRSQHYIKQGGHWADTPLANASSEIRNNPLRAGDLWAQFLTYSNQAFDNALAASAAGMTPKLPECFTESEPAAKEVVIPKLEALARLSSSKLSGCTAATTSYIAGETQSACATRAVELEPTTPIRPDNYQQPEPPDYQEQQENIQRLAQLTRAVSSMPKPNERQPEATSQFEKMRSWLTSGAPALRNEVLAWADKRSDIELLFNEEGNPYDFQVIE